MLVYGLGHKVKRNGQLNLIEAVCYPRDASPANTGLTPPPTTNQYPSVILSTDKVHIKLGKSRLAHGNKNSSKSSFAFLLFNDKKGFCALYLAVVQFPTGKERGCSGRWILDEVDQKSMCPAQVRPGRCCPDPGGDFLSFRGVCGDTRSLG